MNKQSEIQAKYDNENTVRVALKLNKKTDADIIEKIDPANKQKSIKELIRKGFKKNK